MESKTIYSEQYYVTTTPTEIITVLGSCVAVCLLDKKRLIAGMNHYLLPLWNGSGLKSLKYGNVSIVRMIEEMEKKGANIRDMEAKIFGGAIINISDRISVGPKNVQVALDMMQEYKIPVIASDVGGDRGRKIIFSSVNGDVYLKYAR
jgi:chemotaxis protein CheD